MEDEHLMVEDANKFACPPQPLPPISVCAVFDGTLQRVLLYVKFMRPSGHGGSEAASYAKQHLARSILHHKQFLSDPKSAIIAGFLETDKKFCELAEENELYSGTTAVIAFVMHPNKYGSSRALFVFNIAFCRKSFCRPI